MTRFVYHIADREEWERQRPSGLYRHPSLESEGFIHCSNKEQVERTLKRFFPEVKGLVLLQIDVSKLEPELKDEEGEPGIDYPHVYGPLNVDAVTEARTL